MYGGVRPKRASRGNRGTSAYRGALAIAQIARCWCSTDTLADTFVCRRPRTAVNNRLGLVCGRATPTNGNGRPRTLVRKAEKPGVDSSILSLGTPKPLHSKDHSRHLQEVFDLPDESGKSA